MSPARRAARRGSPRSTRSSTLEHVTRTIIDGTIDAVGDVTVQSTSAIDGTATADSYGGGLGVDARTDAAANCFAGHADAESGIDLGTTARVDARDEAFLKTSDLTVDANQYVSHFDNSYHDAHGGFLVGHDHGKDPVINPVRQILWNATTIMLGEANPLLVVDSDGTITQMVNVTVKDDLGHSYGLHDTIPEGRKIEVGDIQYNSGSVARFRADSLSFMDGPDSKSGPSSTILGTGGLFDFQETWDSVRIENSSDRELVTHLIDVVNGTQKPLITIAVDHIPTRASPPSGDPLLGENLATGDAFAFDGCGKSFWQSASASPRLTVEGFTTVRDRIVRWEAGSWMPYRSCLVSSTSRR